MVPQLHEKDQGKKKKKANVTILSNIVCCDYEMDVCTDRPKFIGHSQSVSQKN